MAEIKPHSAHWGAFDAVVENGRVTGVRPFALDPYPSTLLQSMADAVHSKVRIDRPYVRAGWLKGERRGSIRGADAFVPVSWDKVTRLLAEETSRVRTEHGHASIMGGSYGWSSAGRFHHARSQLHRFLGMGGGFTTQVTNYSYGAGHDADAAYRRHQRHHAGPGDGLGQHRQAYQADAVRGRAAAEERAGHVWRRRRA
jgi:biotin/methionine sulfoxide reductase